MTSRDEKLCSLEISKNGKYLIIHSRNRNNPTHISVSRVRIRRISAFDSSTYTYSKKELYNIKITMQNGRLYQFHGADQALYDQLCQYLLET